MSGRIATSLLVLVACLCVGAPGAAGARETREARNGERIDVMPRAEIVVPTTLVAMDEPWAFWADPEEPPPAWPLLVAPSDAAPVDSLLLPEELTPDRTVPLDPETGALGRWWSESSAPFMAFDTARLEEVTSGRKKDLRKRLRKGRGPEKRTTLVFPIPGEDPDAEPCWNTLYFGKSFQVDDPGALAALELEAKFSGGMVIYLNGHEIARYNVEPGGEGHEQPSSPFWVPDPVNQLTYNRWQRTWIGIDPATLLPGENVLSAQVHRRPDEHELPFYFDMRLDGYADAGLSRVPYLQSVTAESVTVMWETNVPAYGHVEYGELRGNTRHVVRPPSVADTRHEVTLDGLEPDTEYAYRVYVHPVPMGADGALPEPFESTPRSFRTAAEEGTPFTFLAYGDSRTGIRTHTKLIDLMWEEVQLADARLVVNTGDIVNRGAPRREWQDEFFGPAGPLMGFIPLYPVLGNHELGHESYYDNFALPGNESWYSFRYGDVEFIALNTNTKFQKGSEQRDWLIEVLEASEATWKVVLFHHPPYSCNPRRKPGNTRVQKLLVPVFEEYGVDLVLLGHDHLYGRSRDVNGVRYIITGGGGAGTYRGQTDSINEVCLQTHHFCRIDVYPDLLELVSIDIDGEEIDRLMLTK